MRRSRFLVAAALALALTVLVPRAAAPQSVLICNNQVTVQAAASTSVVAITGVANTQIYICGVVASGTAAGLFSLIEGTGTTCGTGTLGIIGTGSLQHTTQIGVFLSVGSDASNFRAMVRGNDVCLKSGAGATITLTLSYLQK
jgi:hypothetical protein